MKASSLLLKGKTVLEVINFIVTVFEIPVGGRGLAYPNDRVDKNTNDCHWSSCGTF